MFAHLIILNSFKKILFSMEMIWKKSRSVLLNASETLLDSIVFILVEIRATTEEDLIYVRKCDLSFVALPLQARKLVELCIIGGASYNYYLRNFLHLMSIVKYIGQNVYILSTSSSFFLWLKVCFYNMFVK